jgi:fumarate reductase subunit D
MSARGQVAQAASSEWVERLGRAGLVAKAILYATIAVLALQVAFPGGSRGETASQEGAISALAEQPLGRVVLVVLAVGLAGYAVWRLTQAVVGSPKEHGAKEAVLRTSWAVRGLIYASFAALTVRILTGSGGGGQGGEQELTARLLALPLGVPLVVLVGLAVVASGLYQGYKGATRKFREDLDTARMSRAEDQAVTRLGMVGLLARGVVFILVGVFFIQAALAFDPNQARGVDGALAQLAGTPVGPWLLGLVALGLLAYAALCLAQARYARIRQLD